MKSKLTTRIPILLSAFVCPGAGQFVQKRRLAGTVYAAGFLVGFFWFMLRTLKIIICFYRMAFDAAYNPETPNVAALLPPIALASLFYVINLFDVTIAQYRMGTTQQPINTDVLTSEEHQDKP